MASELRFVGRDAEIAVLRAAFDDSAGGRPRVVVVLGDLGVGKTRLVTEALRVVRPVVLAGACAPVVGEPLPYAPLIQALRRLESKPSGRKEIERFPELSRLMAGVTTAEPTAGASASIGPQWRLYQAVLGLLQALGHARQVALIVDDLQWADQASLDLLAHLAINLTDERVALVVTSRTDHGQAGDAAHRMIGELGRLRQTVVIGLGPLTGAEAIRLAGVAGPALDPAQVETLAQRSGGNPLLAEQLADSTTGAFAIPPTVEALFTARIAALPPLARDLVHALAVAGGRADLDDLVVMTDRPLEQVEAAVRVAFDTHVLCPAGPGLAFRHAACAEVAYADALPSERRRLHERAMGVLAGRSDDASVLALARHTEMAHAETVAITVAAARVAEHRWAFADAGRWYGRAEALLDAGAVADHESLPDLRLAAARAYGLAGAYDQARAVLNRALVHAGSDTARADILWRLGAIDFVTGAGEAADSALAQARSLLSDGDEQVSIPVLAWSARVAAAWSRTDDAARFGAAAVTLAEAAGSVRWAGIAHNALGVAAALAGDLATATDHLQVALASAHEGGSVDDLVAAYVNLGNVLGMSGDPSGQFAVCEQGIEELGRCGVLRHSGSVLIANAVEALMLLGRLEDAYTRGAHGMAIAPDGLVKSPIAMRAAQAAACVGRLEQARAWADEAARLMLDRDAPATWRLAVAEAGTEVALWAGEPERALDVALANLTQAEAAGLGYPAGLIALAWRALGDVVTAGGRPDGPAAALRALTERRHGEVSALEAAERGRADGHTDVGSWQRAEATIRGPVAQAYVHWRIAEATLRSETGVAAVSALRTAYASATNVGLVPLIAEVECTARWYRIDLEPSSAATDAAEPLPGLTAREREILDDVAAGCTNGEIAARHGISVKTASVHVSNILRKLGVPTRQDAARIAHRHGLPSAR